MVSIVKFFAKIRLQIAFGVGGLRIEAKKFVSSKPRLFASRSPAFPVCPELSALSLDLLFAFSFELFYLKPQSAEGPILSFIFCLNPQTSYLKQPKAFQSIF